MAHEPHFGNEEIEGALESVLALPEDGEPEQNDGGSEVELVVTARTAMGNRSSATRDADAEGGEVQELMRSHALPSELARSVIDGRLTLRSAVALHRARATSSFSAPAAWWGWIAVIAVVACGAMGFQVWRSWTDHSRVAQGVFTRGVQRGAAAERLVAAAAVSPLAHVERDPRGNVLLVSGPQPRAVLQSYCLATAACAAGRAAEIVSPIPADPSVRIGLFHDAREPHRRRAIQIHRDPRSRRWVAGDGSGVRVYEAEELVAR